MKDRKIFRILYYLIQWTWGIIQNALGLFLCLCLFIVDPHRQRGWFNGAYVVFTRLHSSAGIGMFIFIGQAPRHLVDMILVHEYGHTIQSCILGPLYLLVIGIPSFLWANLPLFRMIRRKKKYRYTSFYPERWANHLGRMITGHEPIRN